MSQTLDAVGADTGQRVAVFGAAGFIGSELVRALARVGAEPHAVAGPTSDLWRLAGLVDRAHVHRVDVRARADVEQLMSDVRPGQVINAVRRTGQAPGRGRAMVETLVAGTRNLLAGATAAGSRRFLQLGSSTEYGPSAGPMRESLTPAPTTAFGRAKATATGLCLRAGQETSMATVVLRPFMVYGPRDVSGRLVPTAVRAALSGAELPLAAPGGRRDWVFVDDVVDACLLALGGRADHEVVNLGTGTDHTNHHVVAIIERVSGRRLRRVEGGMPPRPWDAPRWVASTDKARRLLGWEAATGLEAGLRRTVRWERDHDRP